MSKKDRSVFYVLLNTDRKTNVPLTFISAQDTEMGKDNAKRAATPEEVEAALLAANVPAVAIDRSRVHDRPDRGDWRGDVGVWYTRASARRAAADMFGDTDTQWKVVVIQVGKVDREFKKPTGWRMDYYINDKLYEGACRFRTRKAAREFAAHTGEKHKINPHFGPIGHFYA